MKTILLITLSALILLSGCEMEPKPINGEWYKFLTYYKGQRTGQFHVLVEIDKPKITMYQDSEGERIVYKGSFLNDTFIRLQDEMNRSGEVLGTINDTSIILTQYDFTYIGTKSKY